MFVCCATRNPSFMWPRLVTMVKSKMKRHPFVIFVIQKLVSLVDRPCRKIPMSSIQQHHLQHPHLQDTDLEELMYAYYPQGGYYRRHLDAEPESMSNWRKYSFVLYLNSRDWPSERGGQLRIHRDSGGDVLPYGELPNFVDVDPCGGTLVLFRSDLVPHEVLDTQMDRIAIVGWFLSKEVSPPLPEQYRNNNTTTTNNSTSNSTSNNNRLMTSFLHPNASADLRALRDACPRLKTKLEPTKSATTAAASASSGLLGDDQLFWFPDSLAATTAIPSDTAAPSDNITTVTEINDLDDPSYWKSVAALDCQGLVTTLSLAGQRLRHLMDSPLHRNLIPSLCRHVVTLDLGNTDLAMMPRKTATNDGDDDDDDESPLVQVLKGVVAENGGQLKQLHLGGNGLRQPGPVLNILGDANRRITTLDLRYNDMGPKGVEQIADYLSSSSTPTNWQVLFLEGNQMGDAGAVALATALSQHHTTLRELYLGQNDIGIEGAIALAKSLASQSCLRKLYLEGNYIGSEGAQAFIDALTSLSPSKKVLEKLYVDNNDIDKDVAIRLGKALNSATMMGDGGLFQD